MRDGWIETTLGEVAHVNPETTKGMSPAQAIRYIDLSAVSAEAGVDHSAIVDYELHAAPGRARRVVRQGDVLVSTVRPYLRGFAVVPEALDGAVASTGFTVLRAREGVSLPGFLWSSVSKADFADRLMERATGSNYPAVRPTDIAEQTVLLPPLVVQRRVVDLVDAVDTYAARTTDQVKVAEACLGALRRMLIDESDAPLVDFSEVATIESALVDPTLPGYRDLPHLGIDRIESRTGRLVGVQTAADDGVTSGKFLFTEEDVIYSKIRPELRKAAFPRYEGLCSADAYPLRPTPGVDPHYLLELLLSDVFGDEAIGRSSRTKMPKINRRELADIRVPCPDPDEQRQIGELLHSVRVMRDAAAALGETLATIRSGLLEELLSGEREIPGSYDELVGLVA